MAEFEAARLLGLELTAARQAGYDATEVCDGATWRVQIKGRCVPSLREAKGRLGAIDITKEFDSVMLVLLDFEFEALAIYEAPRAAVVERLSKPGSKARNERFSLGIPQFKSIAKVRWQRPTVVADQVETAGGQIGRARYNRATSESCGSLGKTLLRAVEGHADGEPRETS